MATVLDRELPVGGPGGLSGFSALSKGCSLGTQPRSLKAHAGANGPSHAYPGSLQKRGWGWGWGQASPSEGTAPLLARKPDSGGPVPPEVPIAGLPASPSCLQTCFSLPGSTAPTGYLETQAGRNKTRKTGLQGTQRRTPKPTSASLPNGHRHSSPRGRPLPVTTLSSREVVQRPPGGTQKDPHTHTGTQQSTRACRGWPRHSLPPDSVLVRGTATLSQPRSALHDRHSGTSC